MYLAEQRDAAEKRKIAELIKERAEQARIEDLQAHAVATGAVKKKQERVEFLYQGSAPQIDREVRVSPLQWANCHQNSQPQREPPALTLREILAGVHSRKED